MTRGYSSLVVLVLLLAPAGVWAAALTCLTGTAPSVAGDLRQIAAVVTTIESTCTCASFGGAPKKTHSNYLSCSKGVIAAAVAASQLRNQCTANLIKSYSNSTCGYPASKGVVPCIKKVTTSGKVSCTIKPAAQCTGKAGTFEQTPCAPATTCLDAADTNRDGLIDAQDSGACFQPQWDLGESQTLLPLGALGGLKFFPDQATVRVPGVPHERLLVAGARGSDYGSTFLVEGPSVDNLQTATLVLGPGGPGTYDNGYDSISGVYRYIDGRLYGFSESEDYEGFPRPPTGGFYASVGEAVSDDDGASWRKLGPAITASRPKGFDAFPGQTGHGAGLPSVVADPTGHYLYAYYTDLTFIGQNGTLRGNEVGMARTDLSAGPPVPGQFYKYSGGQFSQPGLGGAEDIVFSLYRDGADALMPHVTYSPHLRKYVMVVCVSVYKEQFLVTPLSRSGIYLAFSNDATTWSAPQPLFIDYANAVTGKTLSWQASILWDDETAQQGWLIYGHSDSWPSPHYMLGRRMRFTN
jgi:hypothetical protein